MPGRARVRASVTLGALALTFLTGACAPEGSTGNAGASNSGGAAAAANGTFVVARTGDIDKLDPHVATAFTTIATLGLVYDTLVRTDNDGKLTAGLATTWDVTDSGQTVTFHLRDGVKWQNGDPFGAADVKASLNRILDEKTSAVARSNITMITGVDTPDERTVVLHLSAPNAAIFYALASVNSSIVHASDIQAGTVATKPNGTGPFAWKTWSQGQQVALTGNASYWGGAPAIGTLELRVIPSESSILSGMQAGAFQLGMLSDPSVAAQAKDGNGFKLVKQPSMSYHALMLNGRKPPLDNPMVRQALACAVDRQQVIDTAAGGDGKVNGPIAAGNYQFDATQGLPCKPGDVAAAKKLLADSGHGGGFSLKTIVMTGNYATAVAEGQNLKSQLANIGVTLDTQQLPTSPYVKAWLAADFDAAVARNGASPDPYLSYGRYFTTGGSLAKPAGLASQALNGLLVKGNSTNDEQTRASTYQQLQQQMLKESPWVWMFAEDDYYLVSDKAQGFQGRPDQSLISLASTK